MAKPLENCVGLYAIVWKVAKQILSMEVPASKHTVGLLKIRLNTFPSSYQNWPDTKALDFDPINIELGCVDDMCICNKKAASHI